MLFVSGCGGDDGNEPEDPFPDVAGVYQVEVTFDELPSSEASFEGTLELTQASQESGDLEGSISVIATIGDDVFNVSDEAVSAATVSPGGVISFTAGEGVATWTFSGTASGSSITNGRHTLSDGEQSFSGPWSGDVAGSSAEIRMVPDRTGDLLRRLGRTIHLERRP